MERYKNLNGESGVMAYEFGENSITVQFKGGSEYLYNSQSAGAQNIATMQRLAVDGRGLNSFIGREVRTMYAAKVK